MLLFLCFFCNDLCGALSRESNVVTGYTLEEKRGRGGGCALVLVRFIGRAKKRRWKQKMSIYHWNLYHFVNTVPLRSYLSISFFNLLLYSFFFTLVFFIILWHIHGFLEWWSPVKRSRSMLESPKSSFQIPRFKPSTTPSMVAGSHTVMHNSYFQYSLREFLSVCFSFLF